MSIFRNKAATAADDAASDALLPRRQSGTLPMDEERFAESVQPPKPAPPAPRQPPRKRAPVVSTPEPEDVASALDAALAALAAAPPAPDDDDDDPFGLARTAAVDPEELPTSPDLKVSAPTPPAPKKPISGLFGTGSAPGASAAYPAGVAEVAAEESGPGSVRAASKARHPGNETGEIHFAFEESGPGLFDIPAASSETGEFEYEEVVATGPHQAIITTTEVDSPSSYDWLSNPSIEAVRQKNPDIFGLPPEPPAGVAPPAWGEPPAEAEAEQQEDEEEAEPAGDDPYLGTTLCDRYVVEDILGEGGMGRVYGARHKIIDKQFAIKILHAELAKDKEAVGRFVREAQAASQIGNDHIIDISDFGELPDGSTFFVMEYLGGPSLGDIIEERGALGVEEICDIAIQLCDGLQAAHDVGIVHRDLKPDNVTLVARGNIENFCKILDFGIAKVSTAQAKEKLTMAGAVFGTPHYMSPEQAAGAAVDHRTDIYSLGVMLYEMASGELPFNADNFMGILTQHMYKAPVPIRALVSAPDCPPGLEALILKCLSKKPNARYQTMKELAADLRKLRDGGIPEAVHEMMARSGSFNVPADYFESAQAVVPATPKDLRSKGPRVVLYAGIGVAILAVVLVVVFGNLTTAEPAKETAPTSRTAASTAPTAQQVVQVLVVSNPIGALGYIEGQDEGKKLPDTFDVPPGATIKVLIWLEGYQTETLELDGSEKRREVTLKRQANSKSIPTRIYRPTRPNTKPTSKSPTEIVDPWKKK